MKINLKKKLAAAAAAATIAGSAGIAFAYWTTTGAGEGSADVAAANGTLVLHASFEDGALHPGGSVPVTFTADNASETDLQVGTIHSVVSTSDPDCLASDFSIADVVSNTVVPNGETGYALDGEGTLVFANSALNQDACKGATITLTLTS